MPLDIMQLKKKVFKYDGIVKWQKQGLKQYLATIPNLCVPLWFLSGNKRKFTIKNWNYT